MLCSSLRCISHLFHINYHIKGGFPTTTCLAQSLIESCEDAYGNTLRYYLHVRNTLVKSSNAWIEIVPTADCLFRYDRGAFWAGRHVITYFGIPFIRLFHWAFDSLLHTKILYHGLHQNGMAKHNIIQDILLPACKTQDFIYWVDKEFGIYPLWLSPFRRRQGGQTGLHPRSLSHKEGTEPLVSIGLWGPRLPEPKDFVAENRKDERKVHELGGVKCLFAQCHYTKDEV